ncbi:MAG: PCRF domain-containing protein, partial [Acholeplasmatales bacterium]|nr:PCRF domain-containing protein [Acholeplasmatales bacterium]
MEKYELNKFITEYSKKLLDLYQAFSISVKREEYDSLSKEIQKDDFWNDQKKAQDTISRLNAIKDSINQYDSLEKKFNDIKDSIDLALVDNDLMMMLEDEIETFKKELDVSEKNALLCGKYDFNNCILELHPGAGGTESMDWALMLYRMYSRYFNLKGYKESVLEYQAGSEAG